MDITSTLSFLFGIPIPFNNLGNIIFDFIVDIPEFDNFNNT